MMLFQESPSFSHLMQLIRITTILILAGRALWNLSIVEMVGFHSYSSKIRELVEWTAASLIKSKLPIWFRTKIKYMEIKVINSKTIRTWLGMRERFLSTIMHWSLDSITMSTSNNIISNNFQFLRLILCKYSILHKKWTNQTILCPLIAFNCS